MILQIFIFLVILSFMLNFFTKNFESSAGDNISLSKYLSIDTDVDAFILLETSNKHIAPILEAKIVDYILDTITKKDVYNTFLVTLENINYFLKTIKEKEDFGQLNIIIALLEKNNLHFSKIGKASAFLINSKNEAVEVSEKNDKIKIFDFISSGKISPGEQLILSSVSLGEYITHSDWSDISLLKSGEEITQNIFDILEEEKAYINISLSHISAGEKNNIPTTKKIEKYSHIFYKAFDNNISKKTIALSLHLKEKIEAKGKIVKNIIFISGIILSTFILFSIISGILGESIKTSKTSEYKNELIQAREYIRVANQNLANKEAFSLNIEKAEEILERVSAQNIFLNDIQNIADDISIIKKQFNGIEIFHSNTENLVFKGNFSDGIKILENEKKLFVLGKSSVYGPIISGQDIKNNIFTEIDLDDEFLDAVSVGSDIIITTKKSRVLKMTKDGTFSYINVIGQTSWQGSQLIETYNQRLYILNEDRNQIFRHSPSSGSYTSGESYLTPEDSKRVGKIVGMAIDGGIYMLAEGGNLYKFFSSPKYRLESIILNKLPLNYEVKDMTQFFIRNNLNYIYILINNKVWVFEPNTKIYTDTKSLTYKGQIENSGEKILSIYIPRDGEIQVLTKDGIYKINFEIQEDKLIVR